ncbi:MULTISPECIES: DUF6082 family protein [unclassified Streptomyces]|uniref:DUF6082 family protein n=1 Tax=unclassified Streptomyces TaxID=2593676 RepID=UPI00225BD675|nr:MULTISPECIES: DUF6082 family protein [unclassified Streptomyces]MCX4988484.1 DUF6082 family protein [Streptomyces sp. NBC_00568]MCX5006295.1 DUF6082 family protein [Streptomyces sp. NBC_00638]
MTGGKVAPIERVALRRIAAWVALAAGSTALVAITPFILNWMAPSGLNWGKLSNISQTYGGISILISTAALIGVIASISFQARQVRIEHQEGQRSAHRELILWSLSDPELLTCWEPPRIPVSRERYKKILFVNLIMAAWITDFRLRRTGEGATLANLREHFRGEVARAHWAEGREKWRAHSEVQEGDTLGLRFVDLADQAYREAIATEPPVAEEDYFRDPSQ